MLRRLALVSSAAAVLVACGSGPSTTSTPPLDCLAVFDCANACGADADGGCTQGCVDRATPAAHDQLVALVQCDQTQACNGDEACLDARCAAEVAACRDTTTPPADAGSTSGGLPSRYVGTVTQDTGSSSYTHRSSGQAVFVRDDESVPSLSASGFAVYRMQSLTYHAIESGTLGDCMRSADETVTLSDPPALDNHFAIRTQATDGGYEYDVSVGHHEARPGALTQVCSIGGTSQQDFNADINVSRGVDPLLTVDVWNVKATVQFGQTWSWDLHGE